MLPQPAIFESQDVMNAVDGAIIERRTRISRPHDENARCRASKARVQRKDFSQCMQQPTTLSTSNAISFQQGPTERSPPPLKQHHSVLTFGTSSSHLPNETFRGHV